PTPTPTPTPTPVYAGATPGGSDSLFNKCEVSHPGPIQNQPGTQADEKGFVRAITAETYLWNAEVPVVDPTTYPTVVAYFDALKTPLLTANGHPKDKFHFSYPSEVWDAMSSGVDVSYGISWATPRNRVPRIWRVALVEAGSPAALAGVQRGDQLLMLDGVDFINRNESATVAAFNAALTPAKAGEQHQLTLWRNGALQEVRLAAAKVSVESVQNARVLDSSAGKTGYLTFNAHNGPAEKQLYDAFTLFKNAAVKELVIDMRYNGGGLLTVASELAYMVAGPAATEGKTFFRYSTNGRLSPGRPTPFLGKSSGQYATQILPLGTVLPHLDLKRVTVLAGPGTCSASEAVVNGLRGIDVQVDLVGGQTCGKPYAFIPLANCGTTYFLVQYQGVNQKGWGDYADGFAPTCAAEDDFDHALGDPAEGLLATALRLQGGQSCAAAPALLRQGGKTLPLPSGPQVEARPPVKEIAVLPWFR
ncbi:MAG: S41 family peptidase, partial [Sphingomonadaceae bacterium]